MYLISMAMSTGVQPVSRISLVYSLRHASNRISGKNRKYAPAQKQFIVHLFLKLFQTIRECNRFFHNS
jgi:hypothetical protein